MDEKVWTPSRNSSKESGWRVNGLRVCVWQQEQSLLAGWLAGFYQHNFNVVPIYLKNTGLVKTLLAPNSLKNVRKKKGDTADPHVRQW